MNATKSEANSASENQEKSEKKEVMQSNLPLLFANGSPISLESMNLNQLQGFLLFLLKCECGRTINSLNDIEPPGWWPSEVSFVDDLLEKSTKKGMWSSVLRKLIQRCYDHNSSTFLLEFSRKLMIASQDTNKIKVIDNGDGTRSMRSATSNKLLVTFRSENQDYDKKQRQQMNSFSTQSPLKKRCSLSLGINASDPRLPKCEDLYLCDNCGDSFQALQDVLVHEKNCFDPSKENTEQFHKRYFSYMKLEPNSVANTKDSFRNSPSKVVRPKPSTYAKFLSIDVASPLGQYIYSLSSNTKETIDISSLCIAERKSALRNVVPTNSVGTEIISKSKYLPAIFQGGHGEEFPVTNKGNRYRRKGKEDPHLYCLDNYQKAVRRYTLEHGMTPRSMKLYKQVKKRHVKVSLKRLDLDKVTQILQELIAANEERKLERQKKAKLKQLKNNARHFAPIMPRLTSAYNLKKQSSLSVLQSFTSAVQQLCSPEKNPEEIGLTDSGDVTDDNEITNEKPLKTNGNHDSIKRKKCEQQNQQHRKMKSRSNSPPKTPAGTTGIKKRQTQDKPQCIDLCSSDDDDEIKIRRFR